jgi:tetratricopeptide (TPR) repeat protein
MTTELATKFFSDWPAPFTPAAEVFYGIPHRQQLLLEQGRRQLGVLRGIEESNIIIAAEIEQQAAMLDRNLRECADQISSSIMEASAQMQKAVELLGDRLCGYLGDIRWELAQNGKRLEGILHVLRESRSNQARQLVEQGIRHYVNEQYERAEERFLAALKEDSTDYQVLLNLGLVAIHKGEDSKAIEYFNDALRLPRQLDKESKMRASMYLARVFFVRGEYKRAHSIVDQALKAYGFIELSDLYLAFKYGALAGELELALHNLENVISLDPKFFARARVEPDLGSNQSAVIALLSKLAQKAHEQASKAAASNNRVLRLAGEHECAGECADLLRQATKLENTVESAIPHASYSDLLELQRRAQQIGEVLSRICDLEALLRRRKHVQERLPAAINARKSAQEQLSALPARTEVHFHGWFLWHLGSSFVFLILFLATESLRSAEDNDDLGALLALYGVTGWMFWRFLSKAIDKWDKRAQRAYDNEYQRRSTELEHLRQATGSIEDEFNRTNNEIEGMRHRIWEELNRV